MMSIRWKMTLWYTLLMLIIAAAVLAFMLYMSRTVTESRAQSLLETAVTRSADWVWFENGRPVYFKVAAYDEGVYIQVCGDDGYLLSGYAPFAIDPAGLEDGAMQAVEYEGDTIYLYSVRVWDEEAMFWNAVQSASGEMGGGSDEMGSGSGETSGGSGEPLEVGGVWVCGTISAEGLDNVVSSVVRLAYIALPMLMGLALLGGWLISSRALAPVRRITEAARDISGGDDLTRRIEVGTGRDEVHTLAATFNDMFARLERSFLAERQFTSDASHELRTPTAIILAECDMAKALPDDPAELRSSLGVVEEQAGKMSALISRLLVFTRLEQGTQKIARAEFSLSELTEAICEEQAVLAEKGISIEPDIETGIAVVGDEYLLMCLVQNLITNARKFGRQDGHVWVGLRREAGGVRLTVRDDGIGISEEELPKIWSRFYQSDGSRTNMDGSLGLGLAMSRQIARLHGGELTAASGPGAGSTFTFFLPDDRVS